MNNALKIGAVSGLVAGFVAGIVTVVTAIINFSLGLPYWIHFVSAAALTSFTRIAAVEIGTCLIWGVVLGVVYSEVYNMIPSKGVYRGLLYGVSLWLIYNIRTATLALAYGYYFVAVSAVFIISAAFAYGFVLGLFYEFLRKRYHALKGELKASKYDVKRGIHPGAIAGLIQGIVVFIGMSTIFNPMIWGPEITSDIGFLVNQLGSHALFNMVWGVIFGMLFVRFYEGIPGRGIVKGIVYGLVIFLITSFRVAVVYFAYGYSTLSYLWIVTGFLGFFASGLVLGALYKK